MGVQVGHSVWRRDNNTLCVEGPPGVWRSALHMAGPCTACPTLNCCAESALRVSSPALDECVHLLPSRSWIVGIQVHHRLSELHARPVTRPVPVLPSSEWRFICLPRVDLSACLEKQHMYMAVFFYNQLVAPATNEGISGMGACIQGGGWGLTGWVMLDVSAGSALVQ